MHSEARPPESEARAIEYAIGLAKKFHTPLHIAHLSTKQGVEWVKRAKAQKLRVTCEVAPHHLFLTVDDYEQLGTLAKMNPPLRSREHQGALWAGIADGTIDCIATDHAPHTLAEKNVEDWRSAPSGVPGVETMLALLMTVVSGHWPGEELQASSFKLQASDIIGLCFDNPNRIFRLGKQGIREGAPADMILVDPRKEWRIEAKHLHSKCGWTPYEGWLVQGRSLDIDKL